VKKVTNGCTPAEICTYACTFIQKASRGYKSMWWDKERCYGLMALLYTFQQKLINQIVVVCDAFFVDSTAQTSICQDIQTFKLEIIYIDTGKYKTRCSRSSEQICQTDLEVFLSMIFFLIMELTFRPLRWRTQPKASPWPHTAKLIKKLRKNKKTLVHDICTKDLLHPKKNWVYFSR
jgi:hypothetical protein